jgi:hypothetical protein
MAFPYDLVVIHDFGSYKRGQKLIDQNEVDSILDSEYSHNVHKVATSPPIEAPAFHNDE